MAEYRDLIGVVLGLLIPVVVAALIGTQLIRRGLRRRVGTARHCARCNYELTGIDSARCPECGAELVGANVAVGEKRRSAWTVAAGMLIIVIVMGCMGWNARRIDWYSYRPSSWLADDLASTNAARVGRAWSILKDRRAAGELPEHAERKVVRAILDEHKNTMPGKLAGEIQLFWEMHRAGKLTQAEQEEFFAGVMKTTLEVRPVVLAGGNLPYRVDGCRRMMPGGDWWIEQSFTGGASVRMSGGQWYGTPCGMSGVLRNVLPNTPGKQRVQIVERVEFFRGKRADEKASTVVWRHEKAHVFDLTVLEGPSPEFFRMIEDQAMAEPLRRSVTFRGVELKDGYLSGSVGVTNSPTNVAFEVIARAGALEKRVASYTAAKGGGNFLGFTFPFKTDAKDVEFVLRSNEKVGADTVDLFDAWRGDLRFVVNDAKVQHGVQETD